MRLRSLLQVALAAAAAAGCGSSPPTNYYTLASTATADGSGAASASVGVLVGPVTVPASVDRPELVLSTAPNRIEVEEFDRWAAPLGEAIARTVASDLAALLGSGEVAVAPFANFDPAYRVTIDVQRFESVPGESARLEAVWVVRRTSGGATRSGRTAASEAAAGPGFDALAAAHSRALGRLSRDVAAAIRAAAAAP